MATRTRRTKKSKGRRKSRKYRRRMVGGGLDEKDCIYVSSRGIMKSCDVIPSDISSSTPNASIDISAIKDGSVVYVHGSAIPEFAAKLDSVQAKFVLVSGDCDESIPDAVLKTDEEFKKFIESDKILHWFSQNAVKDHPKLTKIPIGLEYHVQPNPLEQEKEIISVKESAQPLSSRKLQCYSNFHFSMRSDREDAMNKVPKDLVFYEPSRISRSDTWKNQVQYAFVLSPHGNGLDCHRTWEALCLGCIPIVKTSPIDAVFDELPVLIVKDWSDVTKELLQETFDSFGKKPFNCERLKLSYWTGLIRSKKGNSGGSANNMRKKPLAIVQYDDRVLSSLDEKMMERNKEYCNKHGYQYELLTSGYEDIPPYWRKVNCVKDILLSNKYRGILWLDTDACIYDLEKPLESIIEDGYDFYISSDVFGSTFCAGVWLVLNTPIGKEIMTKWLAAYDASSWRKNGNKWRTPNTWAGIKYEQGSFEQIILPSYENKVKRLDEDFFQSIVPKPGVFITHFYFNKDDRQSFINTNPIA